MLKKIALFLFFVVVLALCGAGGWLYWAVVLEPGEEIQAENIKNILGRESQVFYSDGVTKLGVFFDTSHRQYVSYGEIPANFVNALIASEDDRFFDHIGFDVVGITRAMIKNIEAGKFIQGGSTLTQQTAKNLFKRTNRDLEAKLKELLYALRLEYHYSKEEIFEFYANQFYVSGNGHGLGVAARYYFDKTPSELTLVECAFIAGSVKRPNYYNPFRKKTEQGVALARERARERLQYVLGRMHELGMIDNFAYNKALAADIEFKNGKVGFALDYAMEMVRDAVSSNEVLSALEDHGISNIATSGARVITSIDRGLQTQTLAALREELSRLDVRLRGYEREEVQGELQALEYTGDSALEKGAFIFGEIIAIEGKGKDVQIEVALDKKLGTGVIEAEGLQKILTAWVKYRDKPLE
jgi:penicillin-binding protein 1A